MNIPASLPNFENPPLHELVIGVQFAPVNGYQQIHAGLVWDLFKNEFPIVQEHEALPPNFETFGIGAQRRIDFISGPTHDRFWFLTKDGKQLIQFQHDKFFHNWRKGGDEPYPRFPVIFDKFVQEISILEHFFNKEFSATGLQINQCEVSYINFINENDLGGLTINELFPFLNFTGVPNEVAINFSDYILNTSKNPRGRLTCSLSHGIGPKGKVYKLDITARGAPDSSSLTESISFIQKARELVVTKFKAVTSPKAHQYWKIVS